MRFEVSYDRLTSTTIANVGRRDTASKITINLVWIFIKSIRYTKSN